MSKAYEVVTDYIIQAIESGKVEGKKWVMPWHQAAFMFHHKNIVTGNSYNGINIIMLGISQQQGGFNSNLWGSYKQLASKGLQVAKGQKGTPIVYFGSGNKKDKETGEDKKYRFAKYSTVFNVEQCENWEAPKIETVPDEEFTDLTHIENFVKSTGADIKHGGNRACFIPSIDQIHMPNKEDFFTTDNGSNVEHYYATLFHELTHWSGHKTRLDRELSMEKEKYAFEELIAELGACFLCADHGIKTEARDDHAKYIESWLKALKSDKAFIPQAAAQAQKAADFLNGKTAKKEAA